MDFLTVRYFQALAPDKGAARATRLHKPYEANAKPKGTGLTAGQLNSAKQVLNGYRTTLREPTTAVLATKFRDEGSLRAAPDGAKVPAQRASQEKADPDAAVADDGDSESW